MIESEYNKILRVIRLKGGFFTIAEFFLKLYSAKIDMKAQK